ncbi:MAG: hypothetical protein EB141_18120 [Verrucomicrobia bacterium]|nr:hypothetical protein [Verrucomicrobiota bacterium]NBU07833.1 hypothetical protein [Pseudomonadota bacterium]NDA68202.1 hypothetical protein [Verrucomicrobiota bacterium]NDB77529.1 hypothetical protein [Verrucomicrobiota bacterium]NDD39035.1 hypothetical protein [Verrucomicrobiota bacterium]
MDTLEKLRADFDAIERQTDNEKRVWLFLNAAAHTSRILSAVESKGNPEDKEYCEAIRNLRLAHTRQFMRSTKYSRWPSNECSMQAAIALTYHAAFETNKLILEDRELEAILEGLISIEGPHHADHYRNLLRGRK